ncbi:MAG: SIMPL domain-containing protein [Gammaproteobacteria bacterium]
MKYRAGITGIVMALVMPLTYADGLPSVPYIQVSGHGDVKVVPDMLNIALTVTRTDPKLAIARADVEQHSDAVIALAKRLGIAARDIQAQAIFIAPEYNWQDNKREYIGQRVTRTFNLTLHDLDRYPALVDGLVKAGVSSVDSITPSRSDMPALQARALAAAMQDAHVHAQTLAKSAGAELGAVFSITESDTSSPGPRPMMMSAARSGAATYEPGVIDVGEDVSVVYLLGVSH